MKTIRTVISVILLLIGISPVTASAQGPAATIAPADTALTSPFEIGDYVMMLPAGLLQQRQGDNFVKAFLPTGQFGASFIIENVKAKDKELKGMCAGMASELGIPAEAVVPLELKDMKGWYCSGRVDKMIITVAVVGHGPELLKIVMMETETLRPKAPGLLSTLSLR